MSRNEIIRKYITKRQKGMEIGAYHSPLVPKRDGYQCLVFDVFDAERLRQNLLNDPETDHAKIDDIEQVDIIGSSTEIYEAVKNIQALGTFDYIVSSHNFEHLPNPIKFLQGCAKVLKPGGVLSMAIPDKRACFDYFRPCSTLGQWLSAYKQERCFPTDEQIFDGEVYRSAKKENGRVVHSFSVEANPADIFTDRNIRSYFDDFMKMDMSNPAEYRDAHCWTFTPSSFALLLLETNFLGLTAFTIADVSRETHSNEFIIHLRNLAPPAMSQEEFAKERTRLLHEIFNECAYNSDYGYNLREDAKAGTVEKAGAIAKPSRQGILRAGQKYIPQGILRRIKHYIPGRALEVLSKI